jgi:hypothetical protein
VVETEPETRVPTEYTTDGVGAWLRQHVAVEGMDQLLLRLDVMAVTDSSAKPPDDASEEMLDAFRRGTWWYMRCRVAVQRALFPTGGAARWLELGVAWAGAVVEGQQPGQPFVSVLQDRLQLWLDLAKAAANDAEETLEALQGVTVAWAPDVA